MNTKLTELIQGLKALSETVASENINDAGFKGHGWNQVHLKQEDLEIFIDNYILKLEAYGDKEITEGLSSSIDRHIENVGSLNANATSYFKNNASYLIHIVPNTILALSTIFSDIDYELFSYENIQDKKLLPRGLAVRLRGAKVKLDSVEESTETLNEKVTIINDAHEAASSLPTDLASLKDAKDQLDELIRGAQSHLDKTKNEIEKLKDEVQEFKSSAKLSSDEAASHKSRIIKSANEAKKLVEGCDDALQITTTQGIAAGFDQKAKELKNSIWVWIIGLLIALWSCAWLGSERVDAFTQALKVDLTLGQAFLHTMMSIFSIGGPLWLAWISTRQINQRFKLSEDYSYKATVAKSFTGFTKFAERFDEKTEERLFNSTLDRFDEMPLRLIEVKDHNSPWQEFLESAAFQKATESVPNLAKEAQRFAGKVDLKAKPKAKKPSSEKEPKKDKGEVLPPESGAVADD